MNENENENTQTDNNAENTNNNDKNIQKTKKSKLVIVGSLFLLLLIMLVLMGYTFDNSNNTTTKEQAIITNLGNGANSITLTITTPNDVVNYKIYSDANNLVEVLMEHNIASFNHLGQASIINSIAGYDLIQEVDWYDIYINGEIKYIPVNQALIADGNNYSIVIYKDN